MTTLRAFFKEETAEAHERLDRQSMLAQLVQPDVSLETYRTILKKFYGFYTAMEAQRDAIPVMFFADEMRPLSALQKDLQEAGIDVAVLTVPSLPVVVNDLSSYAGYLYVKQGSTLGGQFISKALNRSLGLVPDKTQFFFAGSGALTGPHWKSFETWLAVNENVIDAQKAVTAATACFGILSKQFIV